MEEYLKGIYYDKGTPSSFSNVSKLYERSKADGKNYKRTDIQEWLTNQPTYFLFKPMRVNIDRPRVIVPRCDYQYDADTAHLTKYAKANKGYGYILVLEDIFSRYAWTYPLRTLQASESEKVLRTFFKDNHCDFLRSDSGPEFLNGSVKALLKEKGIGHIVTRNEPKANFCERLIKTLKGKLFKISLYEKSFCWLDDIEDITYAYNNEIHSSIKMTPTEARSADTHVVWTNQYLPPLKRPSPPDSGTTEKKPKRLRAKVFRYKFDIGDTVRISRLKANFRRSYEENWSHELFTVMSRKLNQGQPMYTLMSWFVNEKRDKKTRQSDREREVIDGDFFEAELQKADVEFDQSFEVEEIIKERKIGRGKKAKKEVFVKFLGWPKKFNQWLPEESVIDI